MLMSGKQLSLDSRMELVQRLVTDKTQGDQIDESSEAIDASSDNEEATSESIPHFHQLIQIQIW